MTDERPQPEREEPARDAAATPSDGEVFGIPFAHEPAPDDIFASLAEFVSGPKSPDAPRGAGPDFGLGIAERGLERPAGTNPQSAIRNPQWNWSLGCLSRIQKILIAGIIAIAATLLYVLVSTQPVERGSSATGEGQASRRERVEPPAPQLSPSAEPVDARSGSDRHEESSAGQVPPLAAEGRTGTPDLPGEGTSQETRTLAGPEPLSLQLADKLYLRRDYEPASAMYDKLYRRLPATEENQPLRDFLLLRMALCDKNSGNTAPADSRLRTISLSRLPILRALARYHQSTMLLDRKRYLEAAARAYQTAALVEVVRYDGKWVSAVQQQCGFVAAEAMTRHLLSLSDADVQGPPSVEFRAGQGLPNVLDRVWGPDPRLPGALWGQHPDIDPFVEMAEPQLRVFLASGVEQLEGTVLSPQIRRVNDPTTGPRWSVICNGAPIEELLARFAANAGVNIRWMDNGPAASVEDNVRARPVYLYLTSAPLVQVAALAAGSVGLIAQADDKGNLRLFDPAAYSSLAEHTSMLAEEALTLWQRFLLTARDDPRATNAHFATALLQATRERFGEAIAEYKVVANRYTKHALAPHALLRSGMLKVRLRDYVGAHADLKQLVELYPETELSDRACLHLADATMKAGLYEEATGLYRKVYNLGLSLESQTASALGAGRCLYETRQYEEAAKWLTRYTTLAQDQSPPEFSAACLLLGKTCLALHKPQQAQAALNLAIKGELSRQQHVETMAELVKTYLEQGLYLEALSTLEGTAGWQLSQQEMIELALLRARTLRSIGLADKAVILLEEKGQYLPNPELQGRVALELAQCYREGDDLEGARKALGQAFTTVEPGPLAAQIGRELAGVCLRLGQTAQAVSICLQLLERAPASERQPTLDLLASVYRKQGRYDRAVAALLDRYEVPELSKDN